MLSTRIVRSKTGHRQDQSDDLSLTDVPLMFFFAACRNIAASFFGINVFTDARDRVDAFEGSKIQTVVQNVPK